MGKLPGLVNYSDDEDQSSTSSDEDNQQQQQNHQSQPQTAQLHSHQHTTTQSKSEPKLITRREQPQQTKSQDNSSIRIEVVSSSPTQKNAISTQHTKPPPSVPAALVGDRSAQLKSILTPKALPGVDNWGIPPEPQTDCDPDRLEKIKHFLSLRQSGHRLNDHLQRNKAFRNPKIYAKLVEFVDLKETGTNFPPKDFDPASFPASSYIDGILETQRKLADEKAQQQAQGRSQLSFVSSSSNKPATATATPPTLDANAKFAAAMANAAKIANKIAKPIPPQQQQQQQQPPSIPASSSSSSSARDHHNDHSSQKRSSHRQWDRRDDKRRHRY